MALFGSLFRKSPARTVTIASSGQSFAVAPGETVLERALKDGIAYPHDCTVGTCGTCRTRLVSGQVSAITPFSYTLSREELEAGFILACQAVPKSDLVVEVDVAGPADFTAQIQAARLIALEDLTHDIKRVTWAVDKPIHYRAGQYMKLRWGPGETHRCYSFAIAPIADGLTEVSTFVRRVPGGQFTDMLFTGEPSSCVFELDSPHGNFWLRDGDGPMLCVAGGSGLAPILSLLQDAANRKVRRDCLLLFGARGARDLYAADAIADIRSRWPASFEYWPVLSEESVDGVRGGFVTDFVPQALASLGPGAHGYLCGPPPMIDAGIAAMVKSGVKLEDIHYDKFTDASTQAAAA